MYKFSDVFVKTLSKLTFTFLYSKFNGKLVTNSGVRNFSSRDWGHFVIVAAACGRQPGAVNR